MRGWNKNPSLLAPDSPLIKFWARALHLQQIVSNHNISVCRYRRCRLKSQRCFVRFGGAGCSCDLTRTHIHTLLLRCLASHWYQPCWCAAVWECHRFLLGPLKTYPKKHKRQTSLRCGKTYRHLGFHVQLSHWLQTEECRPHFFTFSYGMSETLFDSPQCGREASLGPDETRYLAQRKVNSIGN